MSKYYLAEVKNFNESKSLDCSVLSKIVIVLFNCCKLSVAEFLAVLGPSTISKSRQMFSMQDRLQTCKLYSEILKQKFSAKAKLIDALCPKFSYEFWIRALFDESDYGQLGLFNALMYGNYSLKQALEGTQGFVVM